MAQKKEFNVDLPEQLYPEYYLIKVKNFNDVAKTPIDQWIYFLKNSKIEKNFDAAGIQKAAKTLSYLNLNESESKAYDQYLNDALDLKSAFYTADLEGHDRGKSEGKVEGIAEGKAEKQLEIANNLLKMGLSPEQVSEGTGLTLEQIDDIIAMINQTDSVA